MARYKNFERTPTQMVPVDFSEQILTETFGDVLEPQCQSPALHGTGDRLLRLSVTRSLPCRFADEAAQFTNHQSKG